MKVTIGPYKRYLGPYQIAEKLLFWKKKDSSDVFNLGAKLSDSRIKKLLDKLEEHRERKVKIHIDDYDVWNMDATLAMIIHPMLIRLKAKKHGSAVVDVEDVPEQLRYTNTFEWDNQKTFDFYNEGKENDFDEILHQRWDWVLYEMIWAFEQLNSDWEDQYYDHKDDPENKDNELKFDSVGHLKHELRIKNGLRLFGKYFQALWD